MRFATLGGLIPFLLVSAGALAQPSVPTLSQPFGAQRIGATPVPYDLRNYFGVPGVTGQIVQFTTTSGRFNVDLLVNDAPRHVANFLAYANNRSYDGTIFHHVSKVGDLSAAIQGGAFAAVTPPVSIPRAAPVALEYNVPNTRGTLAAVRGTDPNSATSEWFFNLQNNSTSFGPTASGGGYSVFGRVLGNGLAVLDALGAFPTVNVQGSPFTAIPLRNFGATQTQISVSNYLVVSAVRPIPLYPSTVGETAVLTFTASRSNTTVANVSINGSTLTIFPLRIGSVNLTVRATDTNGAFVETTFSVTVTTEPVLNPLFTTQPMSHTVPTGSTTVLSTSASGSPTYQWLRNGSPVAGATSSRLLFENVTAANAGTYTCVATNIVGSTTSAPATLQVTDIAPEAAARLGNLSILGTAGSDATLTVGAVVGPNSLTASLPLVVRAIGPTLATAPFNIQGVLPDPLLTANRVGTQIPVATNDNWGGTADLSTAFTSVGAFQLPAASFDGASLLTATSGSYTVQVTGKAESRGLVLAELYDTAGASRTASTPRLINLSTLAYIEPTTSLTVGFVLTGQGSRTVLVRGIGPSLQAFSVAGAMEDPRLELFDNATGQKIGENDDWGGDAQLSTTGTSVGAFALAGPTTKDAVILVTLRPGQYSARVIGAPASPGGPSAGGAAIIEVYEVP